MARSLSIAKHLATTSVADALSLPIAWRGYAARAGQGGVSAGAGKEGRVPVGKAEESRAAIRAGASAWGPDPVTGYYRPINHAAEIDAAELREMLLNHNVPRQ